MSISSACITGRKVPSNLREHDIYWMARLGALRDMAMKFARWEKPESRPSTVKMAREYHRQMMDSKRRLKAREVAK